jgi:hypothetical protein
MVQEKDLSRAEMLFVDAKKPELALRAYMEVKRYPEALRVRAVCAPPCSSDPRTV